MRVERTNSARGRALKTKLAGCTSLRNAPEGRFDAHRRASSVGRGTSAVGSTTCSACQKCPAGSYRTNCGGTSQGEPGSGAVMVVLDVSHMPTGCAVWPAFWMNSVLGNWPEQGEVDLIEVSACQPS